MSQLSWDLTAFVTIVTSLVVAGIWIGRIKGRLDDHIGFDDDRFSSLNKAVGDHFVDVAQRREAIANRFGSIEAVISKQQNQNDEINRRFDRLEAKIDRLIERRIDI